MEQVPVRPQVEGFRPYAPGMSIDAIQERYGLSRVIKLASNENPLGTSPVVVERLRRMAPLAFRYAQAGTPRLTAAIAQHLDIDPAWIVVGNGSDEIIDLLVRVVARPEEDHVLAFRPCFSIYDTQARLCGVPLRQVPLGPDLDFDLDALAAAADASTALVFLTNPDNPSGHAVPREEILRLAGRLPQRTLLVVDEAYVDFADPVGRYTVLPLVESHPRIVVLRTFSKMYGLAGLRLGFGVMAPWLADLLLRVKLPFSVNVLAEQAGLAVLGDEIFLAETRRVVVEGRQYVAQELQRLGCAPRPSQANFILFRPPRPALEVFEALLERGIIIRPLASYGLPECLRVSIGTAEENRLFIHHLEEVLA
jgi:histidinol-phosphate aminotransferase